MTPIRQCARPVLTAALILCAATAGEAQGQTQGQIGQSDYGACMTMVQAQPQTAFEQAEIWAAQGGGQATQHCAAVALIALGRFVEAAQRLERVAAEMPANVIEPRARIYGQAGQAWLMTGEGRKAVRAFSAALTLTPADIELMIDRSLARATEGQYWEAIDDLNRAHDLEPTRADILVLRASAYRTLEATDLAADDLTRALALDPGNPDGLLERGILRRLDGDLAGARADWTRVVETAGDSPAAQAARNNLDNLNKAAN
jgi:tetratricopeptide (TPR) repeat protein